MLPGGETIVGANEGSDEGRHRHRGAHRVHQAESHGLDEGARLFDGANGLAIETPLLATELLEILIGHGDGFQLSAFSSRPSNNTIAHLCFCSELKAEASVES